MLDSLCFIAISASLRCLIEVGYYLPSKDVADYRVVYGQFYSTRNVLSNIVKAKRPVRFKMRRFLPEYRSFFCVAWYHLHFVKLLRTVNISWVGWRRPDYVQEH